MKRNAFTMIELIFVIVVMGILAAVAMPRLDSDLRQEAVDNILSAVRYTQHLALIDNKHDIGSIFWQKRLWNIFFKADGTYYVISSNMDEGGNRDKNESAIDPANGRLLYSADSILDSDESPSIFLNKKYGIDNIDFTDCPVGGSANSNYVGFDYMGRPHKGIYSSTATTMNEYATVMNANCEITFSFSDNSTPVVLHIEQETGYAYIVGQEDL